MGEEAAELSWRMLKLYFTDAHVLTLWVPAFALAVLLRVITHNFHHQLIFPICGSLFCFNTGLYHDNLAPSWV